MKNPSVPIRNQTCGLLACSTMPQPTSPLHTAFGEIVVYCESHTKDISTLCEQSTECFNVMAGGACSYHYTLTFKAVCLNFICCPSISRSLCVKEGFSMLHPSTV